MIFILLVLLTVLTNNDSQYITFNQALLIEKHSIYIKMMQEVEKIEKKFLRSKIGKQFLPTVSMFKRQAELIYNDDLNADYNKFIALRNLILSVNQTKDPIFGPEKKLKKFKRLTDRFILE